MEFDKLTLKGFRSFAQEQTFTFPHQASGFFLMRGENRVQPSLGANGSGKSTVWDGITWTLFGKTARGLKATGVCNWDSKKTEGSLSLFVGDVYCTIFRSWNPNKLSLVQGQGQPQDITQEELESILQIDYTSFLNTVLMGQFNAFFFDLLPTEKLNLFSEALQLQYWLKASEVASKETSAVRSKITETMGAISFLEGSITTTEKQIEDLKSRQQAFDAEKQQRLEQLGCRQVQLAGVASAQEHSVNEQQEDVAVAKTVSLAAE